MEAPFTSGEPDGEEYGEWKLGSRYTMQGSERCCQGVGVNSTLIIQIVVQIDELQSILDRNLMRMGSILGTKSGTTLDKNRDLYVHC